MKNRRAIGQLLGGAALCGSAAALVLLAATAAAGEARFGRVVPAPRMQEPHYLEPVADPVFGTVVVRVTEPGRAMAGGRCEEGYCTHHYSSAQAWNADQSLLLITNGCGDACFLDGRSYRPLFERHMANDCAWHPVEPSSMICVGGRAVYVWKPRTNALGRSVTLSGFRDVQFGPYKGNPSDDGDRIVVRARDGAGHLVAFAVDIASGRLHAPILLDTLPGENNACSISPSGRYVVCIQDLPGERENLHVFTVDGEPVQHWSEHHRPGHGDMTTDADGEDVYVGISKSEPDRFHVIKRRLKDGLVTDLLPYGQASHASLRNTKRRGWVFLSFEGTLADVRDAAADGTVPFYEEVVALMIDGSGTLRRLVQTRNAPADYRSETHASPSPDGTQVIWASNWGEAGGPVSAYVARVRWLDPSASEADPTGTRGHSALPGPSSGVNHANVRP